MPPQDISGGFTTGVSNSLTPFFIAAGVIGVLVIVLWATLGDPDWLNRKGGKTKNRIRPRRKDD